MKYLITGITGFVGPHLANLLIKEGHEVYGLIRSNNGRETDILDIVDIEDFNRIKFINCDFTDKYAVDNVFKNNKFDGIFHMGAQSHPPTSFIDPELTFKTNIIGSANLINAVTETQKDKCKFGFISTSEVYGNVGQDGRKITEKDAISPANPYGVSKASTDLCMQERMKNGYLNGFITRSFSHTGPRRGKIFSISSDAYRLAIIKHNPISKILSVGNLSTTRVVLDVRDVARAYYLLMINDKSNGRAFNICGDTPHKMEYFTDKLIAISGVKSVEKRISNDLFRPHDIFYQHGDVTALTSLTGWRPEICIDQTLEDLFKYWERKIV
jgi:GDP-4-dehydro-6-deoxy-D-mannose reductase